MTSSLIRGRTVAALFGRGGRDSNRRRSASGGGAAFTFLASSIAGARAHRQGRRLGVARRTNRGVLPGVFRARVSKIAHDRDCRNSHTRWWKRSPPPTRHPLKGEKLITNRRTRPNVGVGRPVERGDSVNLGLRRAGAKAVLIGTAAAPRALPFEVLESKLRVPSVSSEAVSRTALVNRLRAAGAFPLVLV